MNKVYSFNPLEITPVTEMEGVDGNDLAQLQMMQTRKGEFTCSEGTLRNYQAALTDPQPEGTVWGLDPANETLRNLGVHEEPASDVWLKDGVEEPFTLSHEDARELFGVK